MEDKKCLNCYTCEKGVIQSVTAEMFQKARLEGNIPPEWFKDTDCAECYACEKGYTKGPGNNLPVSTYFIFLTNECNLRCDYCYATKVPMIMSDETIEQVKTFLTKSEDLRLGEHELNIQFFGGEPTLRWNSLEKFVREFSRDYESLYGRKIKWGMTTNGTLLTEDRLKFLKDHDLKPLLSLDGRRETHNCHRKTVTGSGSFDLIPLDMILKYFPDIEIRPTITPETARGWAEDLLWFHSHGVYAVATEVAYEADWSPVSFLDARKMYEELADIYVERRTSGQKVWMKFIDDGLVALGNQEQTGHVCGIARGIAAIDSCGKLYACQRYASMSDPNLAIGDIWKGFEEHKLAETQSLKREDMSPQVGSCRNCVAKWRCRGGCNAMNFQTCGDRKIILENHCRFQQMWSEISLVAMARTGELWGKRYK
jgi:uncharacterized protein